ncbi:MAG: hypothetical protein Q4F84_05360 [Fibrobacter sp.]|nr:hypothetical protein [Fibrobacter sp.]
MKTKSVVISTIACWILLVAVDGVRGFFRSWYVGKLKNPFRFFYNAITCTRTLVLFTIAVMNFFLIISNSRTEKKYQK